MALRQDLDGETIIQSQTTGRYLRLAAEGFSGHTPRGEKGHAWSEVTGFKPATTSPRTPSAFLGPSRARIGFVLRDPPKKGRVGRWLARRSYDVDDTLPGVYLDAEEIVALMERWRQRHSDLG